jgi:hypothetical protein
VKLSIPLFDDYSLTIAARSPGDGEYPTERLQKGLLLMHDGRELAEEGVGFGVPILKRGMQTIFPGGVALKERRRGAVHELTAVFELNLVERLARPGGGGPKSRSLYAAKDSLAALHRRSPRLRGPLTAVSAALRRTFGWQTTYERAESTTTLKMTYAIDGAKGAVAVVVDTAGLAGDGVTELVIMNEQGARHFDRYEDSDGNVLRGGQIGTWNEVCADKASFVSSTHGVAFSLGQVKGARLHRGRELVGARLAWSGFGYSLPPTLPSFGYAITIEKTP